MLPLIGLLGKVYIVYKCMRWSTDQTNKHTKTIEKKCFNKQTTITVY